MTELALTRIFSVVMYYHFAFLAISIALFGLSASGVFAYVARALARSLSNASICSRDRPRSMPRAPSSRSVRARASSRRTQLLAAKSGADAPDLRARGFAFLHRRSCHHARHLAARPRINAVYAADLTGAAAGCLVLIPLLDRLGAPGVVLTAAALALIAAVLFAPPVDRARFAGGGAVIDGRLDCRTVFWLAVFDVTDTKGHIGDRMLFSKWNSFSRIGVYERTHGDWSLSSKYKGALPDTRYMDIDSAASTPILHVEPDLGERAVPALRVDRARISP